MPGFPESVTDADFVDAQPPLGNFDRDFRFKTETVLFERNGLHNLRRNTEVEGYGVDRSLLAGKVPDPQRRCKTVAVLIGIRHIE